MFDNCINVGFFPEERISLSGLKSLSINLYNPSQIS